MTDRVSERNDMTPREEQIRQLLYQLENFRIDANAVESLRFLSLCVQFLLVCELERGP